MNLSHDNLISFAKKNKVSLTNKNRKKAIKLFRFITFLKSIEEALEKNYHPYDKMKCPVHFCLGQESVPAALQELLNKGDYLFSHHRSHGYYLSKKCPPEKLFSEIYGKANGANSGIAGSQDISYDKKNFYSGAILAGSISIAVGAALSMKLNKKNSITVSAFGESAADQGVFWESINYSSLCDLPILLICENNNLSVLSPQNKRQSGSSISSKVNNFGIRTLQIYGNDPLKVYSKINYAIKYIKKNKKPFFIEIFTFRTISHVGPLSDDLSGLKDTKDYKFWINNSPFKTLKKALLKKKYISEINIKNIQKKIDIKINKYFSYAEKATFPNIKNLEKLNLNFSISKMQKKLPKLFKNKINYDQIIRQTKGY